MEQQQTEIRVLRVAEGQPGRDADPGAPGPSRIFSVVLSRSAGEDLGIVATAVDPGRKEATDFRLQTSGAEETEGAPPREALDVSPDGEACGLSLGPLTGKPEVFPCRIPAPGSPHPTLTGYVARAPLIFSVGLRYKDGAMLAAYSNFYNVRVRYEKKAETEQATDLRKASDFRLQTSGAEKEKPARLQDSGEEKEKPDPCEALAAPVLGTPDGEACSLKPEALSPTERRACRP